MHESQTKARCGRGLTCMVPGRCVLQVSAKLLTSREGDDSGAAAGVKVEPKTEEGACRCTAVLPCLQACSPSPCNVSPHARAVCPHGADAGQASSPQGQGGTARGGSGPLERFGSNGGSAPAVKEEGGPTSEGPRGGGLCLSWRGGGLEARARLRGCCLRRERGAARTCC